MMDYILLLESFGVIFFVLLLLVCVYLFSRNTENYVPLYMATAFLFLSIREITYLLVDTGSFDPNLKVIGGVMSFFAAGLFLYTFIVEEAVTKDLRRIRNAFR